MIRLTALLISTLLITSAPAKDPAPVRTAAARAIQGEQVIRLPAETAAIEEALIFSRASGLVEERRVDLGDAVKRGQVLAIISAPEIDRELDGARAALRQAQARENLARTNLVRAESLVAQGFVSRGELDERAASLEVAVADRDVAAAEVQRLLAIQGFQTVTAPIDGIIVERGDRVNGAGADDDGYLFRLARMDELRVAVAVPQALVLGLSEGDTARLSFPELPGETLTAQVARRAQAIDPLTGTMRVELSLPNPGARLPAGLRGEVALSVSGANTVAVPANTLMVRDGRSQVAIVGPDSRVRFVPVTVTRGTDREVILSAGLAPGAAVIQSPNALLREGDRVALIPSAASAPAPAAAP